MHKRTMLLLSLSLFVAACGGRTEPLTAEELTPYQACSLDADCVLVTNGCGCDAAAIAAPRRAEVEALFSCDEVLLCAPHNLAARCVSGKCAAVPGS